MRKRSLGIAAIGLSAGLLLASCGSSSGGSDASGSDGSSSGGAAKVGVILPDTTTSTRYTLYDAPLLTKAFKDAGIEADVQNAGGSASKFTDIATSMIGNGVKVLLIDSADPATGAGVEQKAKDAGVKVIDYDRVNFGGSADYYVSFDNVGVGKLMATTMLDCLKADSVTKPQIIQVDGGIDIDNNAVEFAKGANDVLDPLYKSGDAVKASEVTVKGWKIDTAAATFQQALTSNGGKVDGVIAANDDIANAVITVLKNKGLKAAVTGQDAGISGLQNILTGTQCMTVFKDVSKEADAAAKLAIALAKGEDPAKAGLDLVDYPDTKIKRTLQAVLLTPTAITKDNVQDVIDAGALKKDQICKGIEAACDSAGLK